MHPAFNAAGRVGRVLDSLVPIVDKFVEGLDSLLDPELIFGGWVDQIKLIVLRGKEMDKEMVKKKFGQLQDQLKSKALKPGPKLKQLRDGVIKVLNQVRCFLVFVFFCFLSLISPNLCFLLSVVLSFSPIYFFLLFLYCLFFSSFLFSLSSSFFSRSLSLSLSVAFTRFFFSLSVSFSFLLLLVSLLPFCFYSLFSSFAALSFLALFPWRLFVCPLIISNI